MLAGMVTPSCCRYWCCLSWVVHLSILHPKIAISQLLKSVWRWGLLLAGTRMSTVFPSGQGVQTHCLKLMCGGVQDSLHIPPGYLPFQWEMFHKAWLNHFLKTGKLRYWLERVKALIPRFAGSGPLGQGWLPWQGLWITEHLAGVKEGQKLACPSPTSLYKGMLLILSQI